MAVSSYWKFSPRLCVALASDLWLFPWPRSVDVSHETVMKSSLASEWDSDLAQIPLPYETLERGKGISWEWQTGVTAEWGKEKRGRRQSSEPQDEASTPRKTQDYKGWQSKVSPSVQVRWKVRRKLPPKLQCSQVKRLSWACRWSLKVLHLLLDAGSLSVFDFHVQREKRKREEGRDPAGSLSVYPTQGQKEAEGSSDTSNSRVHTETWALWVLTPPCMSCT